MVAPYCESSKVQYGPASACVKSSTRTPSKGDCMRHPYNSSLDLEKTLLRKVGEAVSRFKMIRDGDRVAVALSGGKDSLTLLEVLVRLQQRAPVDFTVCAFTVEQGKFLRPIEPIGEYLKTRGIPWTYHRDNPSIRLIDEQP